MRIKLWLSLASAGLFLVSNVVAGTILSESFTNNPAADGWQTFGNSNLFTWDSTNHDLQVTWDSTQPNSYFYHSLGAILTSNDDFTLSFDLLLNDANTNADGTNALQLAIGFLSLEEALSTNYIVGTGGNRSNVAEFDFFPGVSGSLPSLDATLIDTNGYYFFAYNDVPWNFGTLYQVVIHHPANTSTLTGQVLVNGQIYAPLPGNGSEGGIYNEGTGDFRLDTLAISSFSDVDSAGYGYGPSSITAHGIVNNILVTELPIAYVWGSLTNNIWQVQFWSYPGWNYTLEKSPDLQTWSPLTASAAGTGGQITLLDTNAAQQTQFYRVLATPQRP
jgi:hypothetical protein